MALDAGVLHNLTKGSAADAWRVIIDKAVEIASRPLAAGNAPSTTVTTNASQNAVRRSRWSRGHQSHRATGNTIRLA